MSNVTEWFVRPYLTRAVRRLYAPAAAAIMAPAVAGKLAEAGVKFSVDPAFQVATFTIDLNVLTTYAVGLALFLLAYLLQNVVKVKTGLRWL